jgi:hypothetical protein
MDLSGTGTTIDVDIIQIGPGMVQLTFATPFGRVIVVESVTPVAPLLQRYAIPLLLRVSYCKTLFV